MVTFKLFFHLVSGRVHEVVFNCENERDDIFDLICTRNSNSSSLVKVNELVINMRNIELVRK